MLKLSALALAFAVLPRVGGTAHAPPAHAAPAHTLTITARDYAFDVADTVVAGRTALRLVNRGTELHHAALLRLDPGHSLGDVLQGLSHGGPPPGWVHEAGGPNAPAPGAASTSVVDLTPGTYVLLCFIPGKDGQPHVMKGMAKEFTVVATSREHLARPVSNTGAGTAAGTVSVGAPDATISLSDYAFGFSKALTPGRHVIRVTNGARQPHEMFLTRLLPGKSAHDVLAWVEKMDGPPPTVPLGGVVSLASGASNDILVDLQPGRYALLCFLPDAKDGKPHVEHGMVKEFEVK